MGTGKRSMNPDEILEGCNLAMDSHTIQGGGVIDHTQQKQTSAHWVGHTYFTFSHTISKCDTQAGKEKMYRQVEKV